MADKKLKIELIVDDKGSAKIKKFAKVASNATKAIAVASVAAGTALFAMTKSAANAGDNFQKMSLRVGVSVESLSSLAHAAELSGSSIGSVETGLKLLSKRMLDADNGLETSQRSFDALGVSVYDSAGNLRAADQVMIEMADKIKNLGDETKATALAQELFGRSGTELLPMLKAGSAGIKEMQEEAERLGITWTQDTADSAANFNDSLSRLIGSVTGVKNIIGQALMPTMTETIEKMSLWISANKELIASNLKDFLSAAIPILTSLAKAALVVAQGVSGMVVAWEDAKATGTAILQILSNKWSIFTGTIRLYLTKISNAIQEHLIDRFNAIVDKIKAPIDRITGFFQGLYDKVVGHSIIPDMVRGIGKWLDKLPNMAQTIAQSMTQAFSDFFFDVMTFKLKTIGDYLRSFLNSMARAMSDLLAHQLINSLFQTVAAPLTMSVLPTPSAALTVPGITVPTPPPLGISMPNNASPILSIPSLSRSRGGSPTVTVNLINNSGQQLEASAQPPRWDGQQMVVDMIVDKLHRSRQTRQAMSGRR